MSSVNKVILIGHIGSLPEIRVAPSGIKSAKFSLATNEAWKDKISGETKTKAEWHNIVIYNVKSVEFVERYIKKGDRVYIEGKLTTRSYDQDDIKKYITEIVLGPFQGEIQLLSSKDKVSEEPISYKALQPSTELNDMDDEIPF